MYKLNSKKDYYELLEKLSNPFIKYYDDLNSVISLPNRINSSAENLEAEIEAFSRSLWGISFIKDNLVKEKIFNMIKNGTNQESKCYWGKINNNSQIIVELPSILLFIYNNKEYYLKNFNDIEKKNIEEYFNQINSVSLYNSNWLFFGIVTNILLKKLDLKYNEKNIYEYYKKINKHYIGNGWYTDGLNTQIDYYTAWAYHFYSLLIVYLDDTFKYKKEILNRACLFAKDYINFYSKDGSFVPYGRSLIYRFAQVSFWVMYVLNDLKEIDLGIIKGIINRNINWFLDKNIFNDNNLFNIGYTYQNQLLCEFYNSTGSPYWAFKIFLILNLDENSKYFKIKEKPLPNLEKIKNINNNFIIVRNNYNIELYPINIQSKNNYGKTTSKYEHIVYSTLFGFNNSYDLFDSLSHASLDSTYAITFNNETFLEKHNTKDIVINNTIKSIWEPFKNIKINVTIIPIDEWHIRIFEINSKENFYLYDFGFAISKDNLRNENNDLYNDLQFTTIKNIYGTGVIDTVESFPNTNILYPRNKVMFSKFEIGKGKYLIIDCIYGSNKKYKDNPICNKEKNKIIVKYKENIYKFKKEKQSKNSMKYNLKKIKHKIKEIKWN